MLIRRRRREAWLVRFEMFRVARYRVMVKEKALFL